VVFEIVSPGNRAKELIRKSFFYGAYGVIEYYVYDPENCSLDGWLRTGDKLKEVPDTNGYVSPCLGVRFVFSEGDLRIIRPDGTPFLTYVELARHQELDHQRAEYESERAEHEHRRAERLAAQLKALGIEPEES
jgi:hypothetical protein